MWSSRPDPPVPSGSQGGGFLLHLGHATPGLLAALAVHHLALHTWFAQDDITFLSRAAGLQPPGGIARFLSTDLGFQLQFLVFGLDPFGYHALNAVLHLLNVVGVYALCVRCGGTRRVAGAAAVLFGASSIAFTPLNWATGVIELLTAGLLLAATLVHLEGERRGSRWRWAGALLAFVAMFSKETALAWIFAACALETALDRRLPAPRTLLPGVLATLVAWGGLVASGSLAIPADPFAPYAVDLAPTFLMQSLATYTLWSVAIWNPVRDVVASVDPQAWRVALPVVACAVLLRRGGAARRPTALAGIAWWFVFLVPVLPLARHSYLYYLYVPWIGGAMAVASVSGAILARLRPRLAFVIGASALLGYVVLEFHQVDVRRTATRDHLPVDRTIRDSELLRHSLAGLQAAALPAGTRVGFVNPTRRARFDLVTGAPTSPDSMAFRRSYMPLEAAMRGGETLRLFFPELRYDGFATTIPPGWEDVECFHYDQRGWLERWGKGQQALHRQERLLRTGGR